MDDAELNAIRAARLSELQKNAGAASPSGGNSESSSAQNAASSEKIAMLSRLLETSARERLSRVRIVRPDRAEQVEHYILRLCQMGQIQQKLTEQDIVQILDGLARDQNKKTNTKIVFDRRDKYQEVKEEVEKDDDDDDFFD